MTAESGQAWPQADELRRVLPLLAAAIAVVAAIADPSSALDLILISVPVVALALWTYRPDVPLPAVALAVVVPVIAAQHSGDLEPIMFEVSLLAFVAGRWSRSSIEASALGVLAAAAPIAVHLIESRGQLSVGIWIVGIAFPWVIGRAVFRQAQLGAQLEETRRELADRALLDERRRIARDVHDFVGHGLAAMMLQVTSARHVLRRDPDAAEEALRAAEEVGRRSMGELRRTVAGLRSDDEPGVMAPVPSAAEIPALADEARAGGLSVDLRIRGDLSTVPAGVGLALYRIAQEALANAVRHAPDARTVLGLALADGYVSLEADTAGPLTPSAPPERERPHYGVIGMRERAVSLGGEFEAGSTREGWRVRARLPLEARDGASR